MTVIAKTRLPGAMFTVPATAITCDAVNEGGWNVFLCDKAQTITKVKFRTATVTTGGTVRCGIAMLDANGDPDVITTPTWAGATGQGYADVVVADADDSVWETGTLTESVTLVPGTYYAVGVYIQTFVAHSLQIQQATPLEPKNTRHRAFYAALAWGARNSATSVAATMESADGTPYEQDVGLAQTTSSYGSGSATNELGNIFQVPIPITVYGIGIVLDMDYTYEFRIYQGTDTVLATAIPGDISVMRRTATALYSEIPFDAGAEVNLYPGIDYRMAVRMLSASTSSLSIMTGTDKKHLGVMGFPSAMYQTARTYGVGNAWTETETQRICMCLLVSGQPAPTFPAANTIDPLAAACGWNGEITPAMDVPALNKVAPSDTLRGVNGTMDLPAITSVVPPDTLEGVTGAFDEAARNTITTAKVENGHGYLHLGAAATGTLPSAAATLRTISPRFGDISGGTRVTITGKNFGTAGVVTIGGNVVTPISYADAEIVFLSPAHAAGEVAVTVAPTGGTADTYSNGFTYMAASNSGLDRNTILDALKSLFEADTGILYGATRLIQSVSVRAVEFEKAKIDVTTPYKMYLSCEGRTKVDTRAQNTDYTFDVKYRIEGMSENPETARGYLDDVDERIEFLVDNQMYLGDRLVPYYVNTLSQVIDMAWVGSECKIMTENGVVQVESEGSISITINRLRA